MLEDNHTILINHKRGWNAIGLIDAWQPLTDQGIKGSTRINRSCALKNSIHWLLTQTNHSYVFIC